MSAPVYKFSEMLLIFSTLSIGKFVCVLQPLVSHYTKHFGFQLFQYVRIHFGFRCYNTSWSNHSVPLIKIAPANLAERPTKDTRFLRAFIVNLMVSRTSINQLLHTFNDLSRNSLGNIVPSFCIYMLS